MEKRSLQNSIRKVQADEGIVEAYLTAWDTIDSYKTSFQRGSFSKTFENRADKIRLMWNHETLAGKVLEAREDEYGAFVRTQFNLDTEVGRTAFAHIKAGDVDAFSFGFNIVNDKMIKGTRTFTEVKCLECSPVLFPANEAAIITDVRAETIDKTMAERELRQRGWLLFMALEDTLDDIFWQNSGRINEIIRKTDQAISDFQGKYLAWLSENNDILTGVRSFRPNKNDLQTVIRENITADIVNETTLTAKDFKRLDDGKLLSIEHRNKLAELPETIQDAHKKHRAKAVQTLCDELREGGFTTAEKSRFIALLNITQEPEEIETTINFIKDFRKNLR